MKKGFTIIEVSILFVIFLIVAFLVAPLSLDDTMQAKNISKWRTVQQEFVNVFYSINTHKDETSTPFLEAFKTVFENQIKGDISPYRITFKNGTYPSSIYRFSDYKLTHSNAVVAIKFLEKQENDLLGLLMYDVNGKIGPNVWGKDVFGFNIYNTHFEPVGKDRVLQEQKLDCSKNGTGLFCSNYYLIGGNFD